MIKVYSETVAWDVIPSSTGYDIYINNVKKSSTTTATSAKFLLADGDEVEIVAKPSGARQTIKVDWVANAQPAPPPPNESPDNTVILKGDGKSIIDVNHNVWTITSDGKISVNGVVDAITSGVIKMAYESKKVWQENSNNLWWYKLLLTDSWAPTGGTATSPIPGDTTTPVPTGKMWGIAHGTPYVPNLASQFAECVKLGALVPRMGASGSLPDSNAEAAIAAGIKKWVVWAGNTGYMWTPAQAVAYCKKYPQCVGIELGNELNLSSAWTVATVATMQKAFWDAMVAAGLQDRVMLPSVGNSLSAVEKLSMLNWCKGLASHGIKVGAGFAIANYHNYGADPVKADNWQHCWTPNSSGESCQTVLGNPPFFVTEFGAKIGWSDTPDEATQERAATAWIAALKAQPKCIGGHWFLLDDGSDWGGFGLINGSGVKRLSYTAYKTAIA